MASSPPYFGEEDFCAVLLPPTPPCFSFPFPLGKIGLTHFLASWGWICLIPLRGGMQEPLARGWCTGVAEQITLWVTTERVRREKITQLLFLSSQIPFSSRFFTSPSLFLLSQGSSCIQKVIFLTEHLRISQILSWFYRFFPLFPPPFLAHGLLQPKPLWRGHGCVFLVRRQLSLAGGLIFRVRSAMHLILISYCVYSLEICENLKKYLLAGIKPNYKKNNQKNKQPPKKTPFGNSWCFTSDFY